MSLAAGYKLVLIFAKLTLDDLFHKINGDIHIITGLFRTNDISFYRNCDLDLLTSLFNAESYINFCLRSEVPFKFS